MKMGCKAWSEQSFGTSLTSGHVDTRQSKEKVYRTQSSWGTVVASRVHTCREFRLLLPCVKETKSGLSCKN
jgi:hypothetical protein